MAGGAALLAELPAVPPGEAARYVAAAYVVVFALVLIYVAIMAKRLRSTQREVEQIAELARRRGADGPDGRPAGAGAPGRGGDGDGVPGTAAGADAAAGADQTVAGAAGCAPIADPDELADTVARERR